MVLMGEAENYSGAQIMGICATTAITIYGIVIIARKADGERAFKP